MIALKRICNGLCAYSLSNMAFYQLYNKNSFLFEGLDVVDILDCDMFEVEILGPLDVCSDAIYIYHEVMERIGEFENGK